VFNGVERSWFTDFSDDTNPGYFVESVALHEIGHFIGLNHSPLGAATMFASSASGVGTQAGLSTDEISAVRFLYPENADDYAALTGVVTKDGNSVLGAAVYVHNAAGTILSGTVTESDGRFLVGALPPDTYEIRVSPLDPASATTFLSKGSSIATNFAAADTSFLPTTSVSVTVTAGATNVVNLSVANSSPPFRITRIRAPVAVSNQFTIVGTGVTLEAGQSNYYIGVASATLPANSATLTITGDGLTLGSALFHPNLFGSGLNFISVPVSVASNATPGLRSLIVQQGANLAVAAGFLEILPALLDYNFDGLDDAFQRTYFSPFTSSNAAPGMDADFDAMSNAAEFVAGTIPTNALSLLKMLSPTNGQDGLAVRWESVAGRRYQVSHRTNEMTGNWQDIGAPVTAIGSTTTFVDDSAASETLLYRVRIVP
jgi:hypothetical protein